ncbi:MAG: ShlB/FhaC/HecB family hemolysin secretion/activation protein [Candidatus Omnitrophota bacterium]
MLKKTMLIKKVTLLKILISLFFLSMCGNISLAQTPPAQEQASGQERSTQLQRQQERLRNEIETKRPEAEIEEDLPKEQAPALPKGEKAFIKKIELSGITLFPEAQIRKIIAEFENKELYLTDMQKAADLITDAYRKKGYITSRAYLPPQKIKDNIMEIRVIEGKMGDVEVKGNKFFKTSLYKKFITLKKGLPFNYQSLQKSLRLINQQKDRNAKAVISPGKETGQTDILLEVKDRFPIHLGLSYDNYASRFLRKNRYLTTLSEDNLLGQGDILTLQYMITDAQDYDLKSSRYLYPVTINTDLGFYWAKSKLALGKEYKNVMARGKSKIFSLYVNQELINAENLTLTWNTGFDYKDIFNFLLAVESSRDRLRVAKTSLDLDATDKWGRNLLTTEFAFGIPNIMGGLRKKDPRCSRSGAGGKFTKTTINFLRLQRLPFSSTILWKNQAQISPYILPAAEQFQLGGINNVRGYPLAEFVGDSGYSMSWDWAIPVYFIPKAIKVPFSKARLYDAFRVVAFYDWANVHLNRPLAGEIKDTTRRGFGCGLRLNLPENFSVRADFAWPLDEIPSDGKHYHSYLEVKKEF